MRESKGWEPDRLERVRAATELRDDRAARVQVRLTFDDKQHLEFRVLEIAEVIVVVIFVVHDVVLVVIAPVVRPRLRVREPVAGVLEAVFVVPPMDAEVVIFAEVAVIVAIANDAPAVPGMDVIRMIRLGGCEGMSATLRPLPFLATALAFRVPRLLLLLPSGCALLVPPGPGVLLGSLFLLLFLPSGRVALLSFLLLLSLLLLSLLGLGARSFFLL